MKKQTIKLFMAFFLLPLMLMMNSCSDSKDNGGDTPPPPTTDKPFITLGTNKVAAKRLGETLEVDVQTNIAELKITSQKDWCVPTYANNKLILKIASNGGYSDRTALVTVEGEKLFKSLTVTQTGVGSSMGDLKDDILVKVASAWTNTFQPGGEIEKSIDGDFDTNYHSKWSVPVTPQDPALLQYNFEGDPKINYLIYHPRKGGGNGNFGEFELWVEANGETLIKYGDYNFGKQGSPSKITFAKPLEKTKQILFKVKSGSNNNASCAEMEFYTDNPDGFDYKTLFTDETCSEFKKGITEADIMKVEETFYREYALDLFRGSYDTEFRVQEYKSYEHPDIIANINKTSTYGRRDNPTGIWADKDDEIVIFSGEQDPSVSISVFVQDPRKNTSGSSYLLKKGMNRFKVSNKGLMYVMYYTNTGKEKPVKLNIVTGTVNGYFDVSKHKEEEWSQRLNKATFEQFDLIGKKSILIFETAGFRQYTKSGVKLADMYDQLVTIEQEFMGLQKYDTPTTPRIYKTKSHFQVVYGDNHMYATAYYTGFNANTQSTVLSEANFFNDLWGPAHELGHTHQTRPGLRWAGTTEVTNNIHSMLVQTTINGQSRLINENKYEKADATIKSVLAHGKMGDPFEKLVPFWQLKLYIHDVLGNKDFYSDVYEQVRLNPNPASDGECQLEFVKIACDKAKLDLTDFFEYWGFLEPVKISIDDYGNKFLEVTQEQSDAVKAYIKNKGYKKPAHKNIHEINDNNVESYK